MRRALAAVAAASLLLASPSRLAAGGDEEIPAHPRRLELPRGRFEPPSGAAHRRTLSSGATLVVIEDRTLPLVDLAVALPLGSYLDPPGREGAALMAGLLWRRGGTASQPPAALDERLDSLGAEVVTRAGDERGGVSLSVPSWELDAAWELFFELLRAPGFDPGELERLRAELLQGIARRNDDPADVAEREWHWLVFGRRHHSGRPPTPTTIGAVGRADLVELHRRQARPEQLVIAVSGDVDPSAVTARLEAELGAWAEEIEAREPGAAPLASRAPWPPPPPAERSRPGLYLVDRHTPQARILVGHRADRAAGWPLERRAALRLLVEVLGGSGSISRLAGRLRTAEGLVYRASAAIELEGTGARAFRIAFESRPGSTARALGLALEELRRVAAEPVHLRELEAARLNLLGLLRRDFDTAEKTAALLAEDALLGRAPDHWRRWSEALERVTPAAALAAGRDFLRPGELVTVVVGPATTVLGPRLEGASALERASGQAAVRLPPRDPLTLAPAHLAPPGGGTDN